MITPIWTIIHDHGTFTSSIVSLGFTSTSTQCVHRDFRGAFLNAEKLKKNKTNKPEKLKRWFLYHQKGRMEMSCIYWDFPIIFRNSWRCMQHLNVTALSKPFAFRGLQLQNNLRGCSHEELKRPGVIRIIRTGDGRSWLGKVILGIINPWWDTSF